MTLVFTTATLILYAFVYEQSRPRSSRQAASAGVASVGRGAPVLLVTAVCTLRFVEATAVTAIFASLPSRFGDTSGGAAALVGHDGAGGTREHHGAGARATAVARLLGLIDRVCVTVGVVGTALALHGTDKSSCF